MNLAMIFIAHDLAVVRRLCDRIAVLYLGRIVEEGRTEDIFSAPKHPYTQALLRAIPEIDPDKSAARRCWPANRPVRSPFQRAAPSIRAAPS